jgi:hypothetical protein
MAASAGTLDATWTAPTTNADGSPLTDLASYRVYYGTTPAPCGSTSFVAVPSTTSTPLPNTTVSTRLVGLSVGTTYSMTVSALDTSGNEGACASSVASAAARASFGVTPSGTVSFGTVAIGSSATQTLTVQNISGGTVTGSVSVPAPFSVVSGSPFSLVGLNATQTVTVRFAPTTVATVTSNVTIVADGDSVTRAVTGTGGASTDTVAPTVSITAPTSMATYTTTTTPLTLAGAAADNVGVTQVSWVNSAGGSGTASGTTSWSAAGIALRPGANVLTVTAWDAAGNATNAVVTVTLADATPPTVAVTAPTSAPTYLSRTSPVTVSGTAGDNVGVTQVSWTNSAGGSGTAAGTTSWSASGIVLQPGLNTVTVTARDAANNQTSAVLAVTYDPTAPTVTVTAPAAGTTVSGTTTLSATATDNIGVVGVQFLLDGAPIGAEQTSGFSLSWSSVATTNGTHTVAARARDAAGNTTTSSGVSVTVSNAQPAGLVAAYGFDEGSGTTVADASGNGNAGTITGATWTTGGRFGNALLFDGTTSVVTVPDAASLRPTTGMTVEAWVYPTVASATWRAVVDKTTDA